jgi:hypothetical protein
MKKYGYIFILLFFVFQSCSKKDETSIELNNTPTEFNLSIQSITPNSASLSWSESTTEDGSLVTYSIFLNNDQFAENLTEREYLLEELEEATNYVVKVIASNEFQSTEESTEFITTVRPRLYLSKTTDLNDNSNLYEYDENRNLIRFQWQDPAHYFYNYQFQNNLIIRGEQGGNATFGYVDYEYVDGKLIEIEHTHGYEDEFIDKFVFSADHSFYSRSYTDNCFSCWPFNSHTWNYLNYATYDGQGNLIKLETSPELNPNDIETFIFEYTDGNLTKIIDFNNVTWEFSYDDKKNLRTFKYPFEGDSFYFQMGTGSGNFLIDDWDIVSRLRMMPIIRSFNNENNVIQVKKDGIVSREITYEYNESDYPINITLDGNLILLLEYLE